MKKAVITVVGQDTKGIIAKVSAKCAEASANIMEISQSVLKEYFAMIMVIDISDTMADKLKAMEVYASQTGVVGGADQMLESRASMRGQSIGVRYGEALVSNKMRPRKIADLTKLLEK